MVRPYFYYFYKMKATFDTSQKGPNLFDFNGWSWRMSTTSTQLYNLRLKTKLMCKLRVEKHTNLDDETSIT